MSTDSWFVCTHTQDAAKLRFVLPPGDNPFFVCKFSRTDAIQGFFAQDKRADPNVRCTMAGLKDLSDVIGKSQAREFLERLGKQNTDLDLTDGGQPLASISCKHVARQPNTSRWRGHYMLPSQSYPGHAWHASVCVHTRGWHPAGTLARYEAPCVRSAS